MARPARRTSNSMRFDQNFPRGQSVSHGDITLSEITFDPNRGVTAICIPRTATALPSFSRSAIETVAFECTCQIPEFPMAYFKLCNSLRHIWIPRSVKLLGKSCFANCSTLATVFFERDSEMETFHDGVFDITVLKTMCLPPKLRTVETSFCDTPFERMDVDPANTTFSFRDDYLIQECEEGLNLLRYFGHSRHITVPNWVTYLGRYCYVNCPICHISFESGSRVVKILGACFMGVRIQTIEIPASCVELCASVFSARSRLRLAILNDSPLEQITFHPDSALRAIHGRCFTETNLRQIQIPRTVKEIGRECFLKCRLLTEVDFGSDSQLVELKDSAFSGCNHLQSITLPSDLRNVGQGCFEDCIQLCTVSFLLPSGLTSIGASAFRNTGLKRICIPESVQRILDLAFADCASLERVDVTSECSPTAFSNCPALNTQRQGDFLVDGDCGHLELTS
jgi:hypothetical protein